jgi:hypothetical protein
MLHLNTIDKPLFKVLEDFSLLPELSEFKLVGGTALALQVGHRKSDDLDFFTDRSFAIDEVIIALKEYTSDIQLMDKRPNGLSFILKLKGEHVEQRKVDIYNWAVKFIRPATFEGNIRLSSLEDIAAFKMDAICSRKEKKDFVDLAVLLQKFSFEEMMGFYTEKFPYADQRIVLSQITNFEDLEKSVDPVMLVKLSTSEAIKLVEKTALEYGKSLLKKKGKKEDIRNQQISDLLKKKRLKNNNKKGRHL